MGNVLIIDDDQTIRDALARVVSRLGHRPDMAATLAEGLRLVGGADVDVVFLDVRMPDGNGLDAISDIRRVPSSPEVIVLTGRDKGKRGIVSQRVDDSHLVVEGINVVKKHAKPNPM